MHFDLFGIPFPTATALAAVATVGYLSGIIRQRSKTQQLQKDLVRAEAAASELERIKELVCSLAPECREKQECVHSADEGTSNATPRRSVEEEWLALAEVRVDPLTKLNNRRVLKEVLTKQIAYSGRYGNSFSLVLLDIDSLKDLNGRQGQPHGDRALQRMARMLADELRGMDTAARLGGDEFAAVLPETSVEGARIFAERLRAKVQEDMPFTITAAVTLAHPLDTPDSLLARADAVMRRAKATGGNWVICDERPESVLQRWD